MSTVLRGIDRKANLVTFVLGGLVSSELMWIIRTENKKVDFERKSNAQIMISQNIVERLRKGEDVDVNKELLEHNRDTQSVDEILKSLENVDDQWAKAKSLDLGEKRINDKSGSGWL